MWPLKIDWPRFLLGRVIFGFYMTRNIPNPGTIEYEDIKTLADIAAIPYIIKWSWNFTNRNYPWHRCWRYTDD